MTDPTKMTDDELSDAVTAEMEEYRAKERTFFGRCDPWYPVPAIEEYKRRHNRPKVRERIRKPNQETK